MNKLEQLTIELATTCAPAFAELVKAMRERQKEYFKTRDHSVLIESKNLEFQVDIAIERILK